MSTHSMPLPRPAGFSLAASSRFVMDFPASQGGEEGAALNLAFTLDRTWQPIGIRVTETASMLEAEVMSNPESAEPETIARDLVRSLNLSVDHDSLVKIGERDPIVEHLRHTYAGLRPVQFPTPWEAAAWAVIGHRIRIAQAATIKQHICERFGYRTEFPDRQVLDSFPGPRTFQSIPEIPGLPAKKFDTLRGIAAAALDGRLDAEHLNALPAEDALNELQQLYGIGSFSAELILIRGAGCPDLFPSNEARLAKAMTALYGTDDHAEHVRIAEQWRPTAAGWRC